MSKTEEAKQNFLKKFNPEEAKGVDLVFQFDVKDESSFYLVVKDSKCELFDGVKKDSTIISVDTDTLYDLSTGEIDGMQAFMSGKLRVEGDVMDALKVGLIFSDWWLNIKI